MLFGPYQFHLLCGASLPVSPAVLGDDGGEPEGLVLCSDCIVKMQKAERKYVSKAARQRL